MAQSSGGIKTRIKVGKKNRIILLETVPLWGSLFFYKRNESDFQESSYICELPNRFCMKIVRSLFVMCVIAVLCAACQQTPELTLIVGTYTGGSSEGIYTYRFDTEQLKVTALDKATIDNPSYLTVSPDAKFVYAVSESGEENSAVTAFTFDKHNGALSVLNRQKVGADPCYILLDAKRRFVATANYSGGSVSFVPVAPSGCLTESTYTLEFDGTGADSVRQTKPHVHCLAMTPDNQALFVSDLGTDLISKIEIRPNPDGGDLPLISYNESFDARLAPRSGPRHLICNRTGSHAYLINEISGMVTVFTIGSENNLEQVQSVLADTCQAEGSADIHLSPDGRFLYVSTRLQGDGIVVFNVAENGLLTRVGYQSTGKHPRNFVITPDGDLMLVACKDAGMIQIFRINKQTGLLTDTGKSIAIDQPVCLKLVED